MKLSDQWLREWVSPRLDVRALAERLTLAGLEVGAITPVAPALDGVVVAKVKAIAAHPTAGKLSVCQVEVGRGKTLQVVCGAPNVAVGMKVALALPGAALPGDRRIEATKIQSVDSFGMLCSAVELGLGDDAIGLLALDASARVGVPFTEALKLDDVTLEIDLTPNRGDCLSVAGLAREVSALTHTRLKPLAKRKVRAKTRKRVTVKLIAKKECPHYAGRVVRGLNAHATTPAWMRERLRRSGLRSLGPIVDITNYVMLELGQPMHAFDLEKLRGAIQVRAAGGDESLALLDGRQLVAPAGSLVIADNRGPIALAGITGGQDTAVSAQTTAVFIESAYFDPATIAQHARGLAIQTESSQRFERGVDPELQVHALERATDLLVQIAGGQAGPVVEASGKRRVPPTILLRRARLERILGTVVAPRDVQRVLQSLGLAVRNTRDGWQVVPPSYRFDLNIEADIIEEVARITGYAGIPARLPELAVSAPETPESRVEPRRLRAFLVDRDYQEVVTYSFVDPALQQLIEPSLAPLALANPISADMAVMRTMLWPGLLQTIRYNLNRQQSRLRLFEMGRRFRPSAAGLAEETVVSGAIRGALADEQWGMSERQVDFYDIKGDIEALLALTGRSERFHFVPATHPALHPGQTAAIHFDEAPVGWVGTLHPGLQARLEVGTVVLFELALAPLTERKVPAFADISRFPAVRRDLAVVVPEDTVAQQVIDSIRKVAGNLLVNLQLFDVYRGEGIDSGRKSLALGLTFQDSSRTLREAEVDTLKMQVVAALESEFGAQLRQ
jgi:phenylalanyl-tRNA synthetase beta chain